MRSGATVDVLAERCGRTVGAVEARLSRMIPSAEKVTSVAAADWLRARLQAGDYPWQEILARRTATRRNARRARATRLELDRVAVPADRVAVADHDPTYVLAIWEGIVGITLPKSSRSAFLARAEVGELRRYPGEVLTAAGQDELSRCGKLRLGRWLTRCARTALAVPAINWSQAAAANDVAAAVRRIVDAAVAGLPSERRRSVLTCRLGLGDAPPQTLQAIGERLDISRERVRQIQDKALSGLRRSPSGAPSRRLLSDLCAEAATAGVSRTHALLTLSRLGMPGADPRVAVAVLAILTGENRADALLLSPDTSASASTPNDPNGG